ncbi:MAG: hypothetical protein KTR25_04205 [Myxococcales bacterium]|nr:hypothetical protein [Myxococcales bacterium]
MHVFTHRFLVRSSLDKVGHFHRQPQALKALTPPPMRIELHAYGDMSEGMEADFTLWILFQPIRWKAKHIAVTDTGFTDVQVEGPMHYWSHTHEYKSVGNNKVEVIDRIEYEFPKGINGLWTRLLFSRLALRFLFTYRGWQTKRLLAKG